MLINLDQFGYLGTSRVDDMNPFGAISLKATMEFMQMVRIQKWRIWVPIVPHGNSFHKDSVLPTNTCLLMFGRGINQVSGRSLFVG